MPEPSRHRVVIPGSAFADRAAQLQQALGDGFVVTTLPSDLAAALAVVAVVTPADLHLPDTLRLLQVPGIGWDGIDLAQVPAGAAVAVVGGHESGVAEYCLAQMLEWRHRLRSAEAEFRAGSWARSSRFGGVPHGELRGSTVGIVGFGAIGRALARRLLPFEIALRVANRSPVGEIEGGTSYPLERLPEMLDGCDFAVVAVALTESTRGLIGAEALAALGPRGVLVNVARGPVVEEAALFAALSERRLGGAILDVWYRYPDPGDPDPSPAHADFAALPNVLMTPHISGWTEGTATRRIAMIAENIKRASAGAPLLNVVAHGTRP